MKKPTMIRTTIYLPDTLHRGIKMMAAANGKSMAVLLREALEQVYDEDLSDIRLAEEAMKGHWGNPKSGVALRDYLAKRR